METYGIEKFGIIGPKAVYRNLTPAQLTEAALRLGEGSLSNTGALVVTTGKYTGRSPKDKFIVDTESIHNEIACPFFLGFLEGIGFDILHEFRSSGYFEDLFQFVERVVVDFS